MYSGNMPDDIEGSELLALFVLDNIPNEVRKPPIHNLKRDPVLTSQYNEDVNTLIRENSRRRNSCDIWLADTYNSLPDYTGLAVDGTKEPIDTNWSSPFIGKTVRDAVDFIRNAPKPPKPLNKRFCAVVTRDALQEGEVLICKSLDFDSEQERLRDEEMNEEFHYDSDDDNSADLDDDEYPPFKSLGELGGDLMAYASQAMSDPRVLEAATCRITTKQILQQLGNDYKNVQVIPTPRNEVDLFNGGFHCYRWAARYRAWREEGYLI